MKTLMILAASLISANAFASYTVRKVSYTPPSMTHAWFCTADGYDYNGQLHSVSGGLKPSQEEASRDAIRACHTMFSVCQAASCFQEQ